MDHQTTRHGWIIEERLHLMPVLGKLLARSIPPPDLVDEKIQYGPHPQQYVMLFRPQNPRPERRSAVFFLHGGGWSSGSPRLYSFVGHFFARLGYPTVLGGYRLAPEFHFPVQMEDVRLGLEAGAGALEAEGITPDGFFAGGISAGAHLASLLAYDPAHTGRQKMIQEALRGVFLISGPLNFSVCTNPSLQEMIDGLLGGATNRAAADPIQLLRGGERTPALLIHGDSDPLVDVENTITFSNQLARGLTCPVEVHLVEGGHHADLAALFLSNLSVTQTLIRWLEQYDR